MEETISNRRRSTGRSIYLDCNVQAAFIRAQHRAGPGIRANWMCDELRTCFFSLVNTPYTSFQGISMLNFKFALLLYRAGYKGVSET